MTIGTAVKERILELCDARNISVNKLCAMSGVTQSTVNNVVSGRNNSVTISTIKSYVMVLKSILRIFSTLIYFGIWSKRSNNYDP